VFSIDIAEEMVTVRSDVTSTSTLIAPHTEILRTSFNNGKQKEVSTIEPSYSPSDPTISGGESRGTSVAPKNRVPTDKTGLLEIQKADPLKFQLLWFRTVIQRRKNAVEKHGLASLKDNDFKVLTKTLRELAFYSWPDDPTEYLNSTGIGRAVKVLTRTAHYGDSVAELAKMLTDRWASGDFRPGAISTEDNDLISIDDDSESEDEHLQTRPSYGQGLVRHIMRGVIRYRNAKGNLTMKLDPEFRKRDSDIFGHNGLSVGEYVCSVHRHDARKLMLLQLVAVPALCFEGWCPWFPPRWHCRKNGGWSGQTLTHCIRCHNSLTNILE